MPGAVAFDGQVINACEAITNFANIGTWGANPAASPDIYLEGQNAINARASAANGPVLRGAWSHSTTATNLNLSTGAHVYMWIKCFSLPSMSTRAKGGIGVSISSDVTPALVGLTSDHWSGATNSKQWFVTGSDFEPTSGWVCYVIDPTSVANLTIGGAGADMSAVNRVGIRAYAELVVGGGAVKPLPTMWDRIAYGTKLTITLGTVGAPVTLEDIFAADSLNANQYGIIGKTAGIYFGAGKLVFGTTGQTSPTVFTDVGQVLVWQNMPVAAGFYEIQLVGNTSPNDTTVTLGDYTNNLSSGGCAIRGAGLRTRRLIAAVIVSGGTGYTAGNILTVSGGTGTAATMKVISVAGGVIDNLKMETAGVYSAPPTGTLTLTGGSGSGATATATVVGGSIWTLTASAANQAFKAYGCQFSEMRTAALASTTIIRDSTFDNFGDITANGAFFDGCVFQNLRTATPINATWAVVVATAAATLTNCKFISCAPAVSWNVATSTAGKLDGTTFISSGAGGKHGITFGSATPAALTFTNVGFAGYTGAPGSNMVENSGSTDAAVHNASGKTITITVSGGSSPSVRNSGAGSKTVIDAGVTVTVAANVSLVGAEIRVYDLDDNPAGSLGTELSGVESHGSATYPFSAQGGNVIWLQIMLPGYEEFGQQFTVPAQSGSLPVTLKAETNA
jgi:hypothetical protein